MGRMLTVLFGGGGLLAPLVHALLPDKPYWQALMLAMTTAAAIYELAKLAKEDK